MSCYAEVCVKFIPVATLVSAFLLLPTLGRVPGPGLFAQTPPEPSVATQAIEDDEAPCATDALPIHSWAYENAEAEWSDVAIRITMRDPFSVYAQSVYEWKSRGQSPMVVLTRVHVAGWGRTSELGLVAVADYQIMLRRIGQCLTAEAGPAAEPDPPQAIGVSVSLRQGERRFEGVMPLERLAPACVDDLFRMVEERVDLPPYRMPFWNEDEWGALQAGSDLPARVYVDGWDTGEITPMTGLRLEPGIHRVVWRSLQGDLEKELDVTVERGRTTTVNVVLE